MSKAKFQLFTKINALFFVAVVLLMVLTARFMGQSITTSSTWPFSVVLNATTGFGSSGPSHSTIGYARIQTVPAPDGVYNLPAGFAIVGNQQNGILTSEAAVPASPLISSGRIYVEIEGPLTTGIAIANPNTSSVTINFFFTDSNGNDFGQGSTTVNAGSQIASFLTDAPFNAPQNLQATLTFTSSLLVSAVALRGFTNERSDFLTTTMPVSILPINPQQNQFTPQNIPQFADGGGWTTDIILTNPTDSPITGELSAFASTGNGMTITLNATTGTIFAYSIPPRSFQTFHSGGGSPNVQTGAISIVQQSSSASPTGFGLYRFKSNGITTTESGLAAQGGAYESTMYVESSGNFDGSEPGSVESGIALAYSGATQSIRVQFTLFAADGTMVGQSQTVAPSGQWQTAFMLSQIPGIPLVTPPFKGTLMVQAPMGSPFAVGFPPISAVALRARYNERGDLLLTSTPPHQSGFFTQTSELLFPYFTVGGGFETQFQLFSLPAPGTMYFFDQSGNPLSLPMQ